MQARNLMDSIDPGRSTESLILKTDECAHPCVCLDAKGDIDRRWTLSSDVQIKATLEQQLLLPPFNRR